MVSMKDIDPKLAYQIRKLRKSKRGRRNCPRDPKNYREVKLFE